MKKDLTLNKQFPVDKFLAKYFSPKVATTFILSMVGFTIGAGFVPLHYRHVLFIVCLVLMAILILTSFPILIWSIIWSIKHPIKRECCQECGHLKPIKYDE